MEAQGNSVLLSIVLRAIDAATATITRVQAEVVALTSQATVMSGEMAVAGAKMSASMDETAAKIPPVIGLTQGLAIGFGLLGAAILLHGVKSAVAFQDEMMLVHTQAGATIGQMNDLTKSVEQLALSPVGISAEELSKGLYHIESASKAAGLGLLSDKQAMDELTVSAELARVGHANLESTSNGLIAVMVSGIAGVHGFTNAAAELNAIVGTGNVRMQELDDGIATGVLPVFKEAGLTLQDYGAALATSTDEGIKADVVSTRLRMTIALMEKPTAAATKELKSIGMSATQMAEDLHKPKGLLVAIQDLVNHLKAAGDTSEQAAGVIQAAFGKSKSSAEIELLIDNLDRLAAKYKQQAQAVGNWRADVEAAESTVAAHFDQLKEVFGTVILVIASGLLPVLGALEVGLVKVGQVIGSVLTFSPPVTAAVLALAGGFAVLNVAILAGDLAVAAWGFGLRNLLPVISHEGAIIQSSKNVFDALTGSKRANAAATEELRLKSEKAAAAALAEQRATELRSAADEVAKQRAVELTAAEAKKSAQIALTEARINKATTATALNNIENNKNATALEKTTAKEADAAAAKELDTAQTNYATASLAKQKTELAVLEARSAQAAVVNGELATSEQAVAAGAAEEAPVIEAAAVAKQADTVASTEDAVATGTLAASVDALMVSLSGLAVALGAINPAVWAALAVGVGIVAYEKIPAFHKAVNDTGNYLKEDFLQAVDDAKVGIKNLGAAAVDTASDVKKLTESIIDNITHSAPWKGAIDDVKSSMQNLRTQTGDFMGTLGSLAEKDPYVKAAMENVTGATHKLGDAAKLAGDHIGYLKASALLLLGPFASTALVAGLINNKLREQIENGKEAAATIDKIRQHLVDAEPAYQNDALAIAKAAQAQKQLTQATTDYASELEATARGALVDQEAALHAAEGAMTSWANAAVADAKRMSDGMTAEINKVRTLLALPLPEMKLPASQTITLPSPAGSAGADTHATIEAAVKIQEAMNQFAASADALPKNIQSLFVAATDSMKQKLEGTLQTFTSKLKDEHARHEQKLASLLQDAEAKEKADRDAFQQKMDAQNQAYTQALDALNTKHDQTLQTILQSFETSFGAMLADFQAKSSELQQAAEQTNQMHQDAMSALEAKEQADLATIEANNAKHSKEWVAQHEQALAAAYAREVGLEDKRYSDSLGAVKLQQEKMDTSFTQGVQRMDAALQNKINSEKQAYDDAVAKLNDAHKRHETAIAATLQKHVSDIKTALDKAVADEQRVHDKHVSDLLTVFEKGAQKFADAIKNMRASDVLSKLEEQAQKAYNDALEKATLDILLHGRATEADIRSLQHWAAVRDAITKAELEAQKESDTTKKGQSTSLKPPGQESNQPVKVTIEQIVQAQDVIVEAAAKIIEANTEVLKDKADIQVAKTEAMTTAIKGVSEEIKAQADVNKVFGDNTVKSIEDNVAVNRAQYSLTQADNPRAIELAKAQLKLEQDTLSFDQQEAAAQLAVSEDQLQEAVDKASSDAAIAKLHIAVVQDQLNIDKLKLQLAKDQAQLALDQLAVLSSMDHEITGSTDGQQAVIRDQKAIANDDLKIAQATQDQAKDAAKEAIATANANAATAIDAQQTASDQARLTGVQTQGAIQKAQDQAHIDALDGQKHADYNKIMDAQDKVTEANTALIDANTSIIKDNSALQVAKLEAVAAAIEDGTKVIADEGGIAKAQTDAVVKQIQDGSEISKAQAAMAQATDAASLAVAQAELRLAMDKLHFDQMAASAAIVVAQAQLAQDLDKERLDAMDAQAKQRVLEDALKVDELKVALVKDQLKLAVDQLKLLGDINDALGGASDADKMIAEDQAKITQDNQDIAKAMQQQEIDQAALAAEEAQAKIAEAQDAQQVELAKQLQQQIENNAAIKEAQDQASIDAAEAMKNASKNTQDTIQAIKDTQSELRDDLLKLIGIEERGLAGLGRLDVTGANVGNMLNGWASDAARSAGVPA